MNINFFWAGKDFQFLNRLTLLSHVRVGHKVRIWLEGEEPDSRYWISDIPEIEIRRAGEILSTAVFMQSGGNPRTASTLFSFAIVSKTGEYYSDTDAIALKHWPDVPTVICTYGEQDDGKGGRMHITAAVGVIRLPQKHPVLECAMKNIARRWGNVRIFSTCCERFDLKANFPPEAFYPLHFENNWSARFQCHCAMLEDLKIPDSSYSLHYYSNKTSRINITHEWFDRYDLGNSLLKELSDWIFRCYTFERKK